MHSSESERANWDIYYDLKLKKLLVYEHGLNNSKD